MAGSGKGLCVGEFLSMKAPARARTARIRRSGTL